MAAAKAVPWAFLGLIVGAAVGFAWGQSAKSRISEAVSAGMNGGVVRVEFDTVAALRAGLPDAVNRLV